MIRFVILCPDCGTFSYGLTLMSAWDLMKEHPTAILTTVGQYDDILAEVLAEACEAVAA